MGAANVSMNMQDNPYVPFPSKILEVIRHTQKEYTFRMEFVGDVKPGQFFEVSMPKYGEAPISVRGIGDNFVDLTIRKVGRVTGEVFEKYGGVCARECTGCKIMDPRNVGVRKEL